MILALEQRVLTLQLFLDAMSKEFFDYLTCKKEVDILCYDCSKKSKSMVIKKKQESKMKL